MLQGPRRTSHELISISAVASALHVNSTEAGDPSQCLGCGTDESHGRR